MKFLAIAKQKDSLMMTPPGTIRQIMEASWKAMQQQKAQGKIVDYFYSPGGYSIVIVEEPTIEDWVRDQMAVPILSYYDQEVYPLGDLGAAIEGFIEKLKAAGG